jgi:hypothetical protein
VTVNQNNSATGYQRNRQDESRDFDDQENYFSSPWDQKAIEIQARPASHAKDVERLAPGERPNISQHEIQENSLS